MGKKMLIYTSAILFFMLSVLGGCTPPPAPVQGNDGINGAANESPGIYSDQGNDTRVALLMTGTIGDGGWSESSYRGYQKAKEEFGFDGAYTESLQIADFESSIRDYASNGFNIIVLSSADFSEVAKAVAPEFPDVRFVIINGQYAQEPNLANFRPNTPETGFLAGAFAGLVTSSNTVASVGAKKLPPIQDAMTGFEAGAKYVNPEVMVLQSYIDSFTDVAKETEATIAMIESNADILCAITGQVAVGAIEAAKENGAYVVGYIDDQHEVAPGTIPFSVIQDVGDVVYAGIESALSDDFQPTVVLSGAKDGAIRLSEFYDMNGTPVPDEVREKMQEIYSGIVDGSLLKEGILPRSGFEE